MMLENLFAQAGQSRVFLQMCLLGLAAGLGSDLSRGLERIHPLLGWLGDAALTAGVGLGVLIVLITGSSGLRLYALLGLAVGAALYHAGLRHAAARLIPKKRTAQEKPEGAD